MNDLSRFTPEQFNRLYDRARAEAEALRREAIADFWRGADHLLGQAWSQAERSARRLAQRLQRWQRGRSETQDAGSPRCC